MAQWIKYLLNSKILSLFIQLGVIKNIGLTTPCFPVLCPADKGGEDRSCMSAHFFYFTINPFEDKAVCYILLLYGLFGYHGI